MTILVTGAGSKAGVEIVRRLAAAGAPVRTTSHLRGEAGDMTHERAEVDFTLPETLEPALSGVDKAVLIIPESRVMSSMAVNLVAAAERAKVGHIVLLSFLHADRSGGGALLGWHREAEEVVQASPVPSTCLRPNYYMQNFLKAYPPAESLGGGNVSYVDAADVAEVIAQILLGGGHENMTYSLTGPRALSIQEVAALLRGEAGPLLTYVAGDHEEACQQRRRSGQSAHMQALCEFWAAAGEDQFADVTPDFEQLTGRRPRTFESFVQEHREELRALRAARAGAV
jgi:uncharacterized protein YbjT (DUF2867 family)